MVLALQPSGFGQEALLVVFDQIDAEARDELNVGFRKRSHPWAHLGAEAAIFDLLADLLGWILRHQIAEAIEPVFQERLVGCFSFVEIKSCFDVQD